MHSLGVVGAPPAAKEVEETRGAEAERDQEIMDGEEEVGEVVGGKAGGFGESKVPLKKGGEKVKKGGGKKVEKVERGGGGKTTRKEGGKEGGGRGPWRGEDGEKVLGRKGPRRLDLGHLCTRCTCTSTCTCICTSTST